MNLWEFLLVAAIAGMFYQAWRTKHLAKMGGYEDGRGEVHQANSGREAELQREVEELRERIHVLERIATEDTEAKRLSAEIENLRDKGNVK